jgi:hypothetical protein
MLLVLLATRRDVRKEGETRGKARDRHTFFLNWKKMGIKERTLHARKGKDTTHTTILGRARVNISQDVFNKTPAT